MFDVNINRMTNRSLLKSKELKEIRDSIGTADPNAFYIGVVVDTNDDLKLGRVRVRVPGIHGLNPNQQYYLADNALPWAIPAILNGGGNDCGQFIVPSRGTRVIVSFECGDFSKPLYFGGVPLLINTTKHYNDNKDIFDGELIDINTDDRITDLDKSSAQSVVYKSLKGSTIIIDDKDGNENIEIIDASGQIIKMENTSGDILNRRGNHIGSSEDSKISIVSGGTVKIECKNLDLEYETTNVPGVGVSNYSELPDKPSINYVTLVGNKSLEDLDIQEKGDYPDEALTNSEIEALLNN